MTTQCNGGLSMVTLFSFTLCNIFFSLLLLKCLSSFSCFYMLLTSIQLFLCPFVVLLTQLNSNRLKHNSPEPGGDEAQDHSQELLVFLGLPHLYNPHSLREQLVILLNVLVCCHLFVLLFCLNGDVAVSPYIASYYCAGFVSFC